MERIDCENNVEQLDLYTGLRVGNEFYGNLTFPITVKASSKISAVHFNAYTISGDYYGDHSWGPTKQAFVCLDGSGLQTDIFRFTMGIVPFCSQSLRAVSRIARAVTLQVLQGFHSIDPIIIPEVMLEFSQQLQELNIYLVLYNDDYVKIGKIACTCQTVMKFYTFFVRVNVTANCQDGIDVTKWILSNYQNCTNETAQSTTAPDEINGTLFAIECEDWCNITTKSVITSESVSVFSTVHTTSVKIQNQPTHSKNSWITSSAFLLGILGIGSMLIAASSIFFCYWRCRRKSQQLDQTNRRYYYPDDYSYLDEVESPYYLQPIEPPGDPPPESPPIFADDYVSSIYVHYQSEPLFSVLYFLYETVLGTVAEA